MSSILFHSKNVVHRVIVKFYHAFLPNAKKPYIVRPVYQETLNVHEVASKAAEYNVDVPPEIIEKGANAYLALSVYLAADKYRIVNDVYTLQVNVPGEFEGTETHLPPENPPQMRLTRSAAAREYISEHVQVLFDGKADAEGYIAHVVDALDGSKDETITLGYPVEIQGAGLKIASDAEHADQVGVFIQVVSTGSVFRIDPKLVTVNHANLIAFTVPAGWTPGLIVYVFVRTYSPAKGGAFLKDIREVKTDFTVRIRNTSGEAGEENINS